MKTLLIVSILSLSLSSQAMTAKTVCSGYKKNHKTASLDVEKKLKRKGISPYKVAMVPTFVGSGKKVAVCQSYAVRK